MLERDEEYMDKLREDVRREVREEQKEQGEKHHRHEERDFGRLLEPLDPGERRAGLLEQLERLKNRPAEARQGGVEERLNERLKGLEQGESHPLEVLLRSRGLEEVPLARITSEDRLAPGDFAKVGEAEMRRGLTHWRDLIRPALARGEALERSDWADLDRAQGLEYRAGLERVYCALLERLGDPIRLEAASDGSYSIINGRHRVQVGRDLGLESLPASVGRKKTQPG